MRLASYTCLHCIKHPQMWLLRRPVLSDTHRMQGTSCRLQQQTSRRHAHVYICHHCQCAQRTQGCTDSRATTALQLPACAWKKHLPSRNITATKGTAMHATRRRSQAWPLTGTTPIARRRRCHPMKQASPVTSSRLYVCAGVGHSKRMLCCLACCARYSLGQLGIDTVHTGAWWQVSLASGQMSYQ